MRSFLLKSVIIVLLLTMLLTVIFSLLFGLINAYPDAKAVAEISTSPMVITPLGNVQGSSMKTRSGKLIYAFRGIPYAKPPVGELRFKSPEPIEKWNETFDASKDGPMCPQDTTETTSEDCLVLNVYTTALPKGDKSPKRPVLVFFHPGGFYSESGQSSYQGPQYLMDKEIVLVTSNYRLGLLGFLSTGDKEAPGNNGLKDQVQVLKWVKQNIESFGGDPDLVTIGGYSAGAAGVSLHMVSQMSRGLFHRAIVMSGSAMGNWPIQHDQLELARKQARLVGCPDTNSTEIVKCLKAKPAAELAKNLQAFKEFGQSPILIWLPVIEPDCGQERFLIEDPTETFVKGEQAQVPLMTGITADEVAYLAIDVLKNDSLAEEINKDFEQNAPIAFVYERGTDKSKEISKKLKEFYFKSNAIDNTTLVPLTQIFSDGIIGFGVHRLAQLVASSNINPVYYYKFAYKGRYSNFYLPGAHSTEKVEVTNGNEEFKLGALHMDDYNYLMYRSKRNIPIIKDSDPESKIVDHLTTMWSNFARTGNPTPEAPELWKRLTVENKSYLNIDENLTIEANLYADRYAEWDKLFSVKHLQNLKHDSGTFKHNQGFQG